MNLDVPADFSGVVSVRDGDDVEFEQAYGFADRAHRIAMTTQTRLAMASGSKAFTAATLLSLVVDGALGLDTTARSMLGAQLPLIDDAVTVEQLLKHRSGIGDYVDEDLPEPAPLAAPNSALDSTPAYLAVLAGWPAKFAPGERFSYCNSGFVVLALLAERATGAAFADLVAERVLRPAGMASTGYLRSDALPGDAAIGYLDDGRTNVFAVPALGSGDGGAYTTVADVRAFWTALVSGAILPPEQVRRMSTPTSTDTGTPLDYGLGVWLAKDGATLVLEGADLGVSFRSVHTVAGDRTSTVISNTSAGAWPVARQLAAGI
jgi:CubicO group peptidase (beta-lactamase class C family)